MDLLGVRTHKVDLGVVEDLVVLERGELGHVGAHGALGAHRRCGTSRARRRRAILGVCRISGRHGRLVLALVGVRVGIVELGAHLGLRLHSLHSLAHC